MSATSQRKAPVRGAGKGSDQGVSSGRGAARVDVSDKLVEALLEGVEIMAGRKDAARVHLAPGSVDVRAIRDRLGLSQPEFASRFGFALATVRDWEQGRRQPEQAARTLLLVIDRTPAAVTEALAAARGG
jgi:putative transcriptional regulator